MHVLFGNDAPVLKRESVIYCVSGGTVRVEWLAFAGSTFPSQCHCVQILAFADICFAVGRRVSQSAVAHVCSRLVMGDCRLERLVRAAR